MRSEPHPAFASANTDLGDSRGRLRLIRVGRKQGSRLKELITIVTCGSFLRWLQNATDHDTTRRDSTWKPGRRRTSDDIWALVVKLAQENSWRCTRVLGEPRKLGIRKISRQTVKNILKGTGSEESDGLDSDLRFVMDSIELGPFRVQLKWSEIPSVRNHPYTVNSDILISARQ
ncbi:MAG: Integrase core domain protein [Planctomycetaceae bacterium]|nr:Integrase core domain protein [Planctomycetaceae bacterium]